MVFGSCHPTMYVCVAWKSFNMDHSEAFQKKKPTETKGESIMYKGYSTVISFCTYLRLELFISPYCFPQVTTYLFASSLR